MKSVHSNRCGGILCNDRRGLRSCSQIVMQSIATFETGCTLQWKQCIRNQTLNRQHTNPLIQTCLVFPTQMRVETLEDVLSFFNQNSNGIKSMKQAAGSHRSDGGQQSLDPVGQQLGTEQVVTEKLLTKSRIR